MYLGRAFVPPSTGIQGRVNSGSFTTSHSRINFVQGSNVTISINDDTGDDEIEITITSIVPPHTHSGSQIGLSPFGVANGLSSSSTSGVFYPANQSINSRWGICFSAGGIVSGTWQFVAFGATIGIGSNQGSCSVSTNGSFNVGANNGYLWFMNGYQGFTTTFSGSTWAISFSQPSGATTLIYATSIGWFL